MKSYILSALCLLGLTTCKQLGIGKQCYTCTTEALARPSLPKQVHDICGNTEKESYVKDNTKSVGGIFFQTTCKEKP